VEVPAQEHREVAGDRLLLDRRLERDQEDAAAEHRGEREQALALLRPHPRGLDLREPVDDVAEHRRSRYASNTPIRADRIVSATSHVRSPAVAAHRNAKKPCGGVAGGASGNGIDQSLEEPEHGQNPTRRAETRPTAVQRLLAYAASIALCLALGRRSPCAPRTRRPTPRR
jgi:hypothetical protein